ncbi:cytochrome b/b6 domain-containing protein [Mesorhizobium sp. WSM4904]|uniref:cytochrome b/b6 domain-containing protein n=1 Tax=Mesorhizobium sp. WSM4904 TaxID=3038545 RepID=UPI0024186F13|nr:cytochrome b/b6 domain-containing protein [Mesorhizobium sp. WSM4904]WFP65006.1 cytochrome b/b6 domain-containing protein [Mesorhizobium sp. WSM4904]
MNATVRTRETSINVWSYYVRLFHWALVLSVAVAWLTSGEIMMVHKYAGYLAIALVASRLTAGLFGSGYTRFAQFVRSPRQTLNYLKDIAHKRERRYIGHNPAGAAMVLALLACICGIALTGWMQTTDAYWGVAWVQLVHELLGNAILVLIAIHIAGVALASIRHGENLVRSMINGRKRSPDVGDIA